MDAVRGDGVDDLYLLEDPQGRVAAPDGEVDHERRLEHAFGGLGHVLRVGVLRKELIQADADQGDDEEPGGCGQCACPHSESIFTCRYGLCRAPPANREAPKPNHIYLAGG